MKLSFGILILAIITQISGCSHYYASKTDFNTIISQWLKQNEFTKIENSMEKLSSNHPDFKLISARLKNINHKKQAFINTTITKAKKQQSLEKWQAGIDIYTNALIKINNDAQLLKAKKELSNERNTQVAELRKNMLLRRAKALIQYKPIYIKLKKLIPNDHRAQYDIKEFENEKHSTSMHLLKYGNHALNNKNYTLAEECYDLSEKLVPSNKTEKLKNKIQNIIKHDSDKQMAHDLINAYHTAYESGNFPKARMHLDQLLTVTPNHKQSKLLIEQLDRDINTRIEKGITLGKTQYSEGKINLALKTWQDLSKLDPKNEELSTLINRAQKVSTKIETLEKLSPDK